MLSRTQVPGLRQSLFRVTLPSSIDQIKIILHRHTQELVPWRTLEQVVLNLLLIQFLMCW